jgi:predicted transcriptional regulator
MLSKTELKLLVRIKDEEKLVDLVESFHDKSSSQIYSIIRKLESKGIIFRKQQNIFISKAVYLNKLIVFLEKNNALIELFSKNNWKIFYSLLDSNEISKIYFKKKSSIYNIIRIAKKFNVVKKINGLYEVNDKIWPDFKEIILLLNEADKALDSNVPVNCEILIKQSNKVIFLSKRELNYFRCGFSLYDKINIKIYLRTIYYCTAKRNTIKQIVEDSLDIADKTKAIQDMILAFVAYKKTGQKFQNNLVDILNKILSGVKIDNFPTRSELLEKLELYEVNL